MKLFKIDLFFKHGRRGRVGVETVVHARSRTAAEKFLASKFTGSTIERLIELKDEPKHFVIADLER